MPFVDSQTWTSYITLDEARTWLQFPANASTANDGVLEDIIAMACEFVQNYINHPIAPTRFTERHDGWSGEYIMLNQYPIVEMVSVQEFQSAGGVLNLSESTPENPVDGYQVNYLTGRIMRVFLGYSWPRPWFPGSRNIEVTYYAGYNPLPPAIRIATRELIKHWWVNTQQASRDVVRVNDYDPGPTQDGLWQGVPNRITGILAPYRRVIFG